MIHREKSRDSQLAPEYPRIPHIRGIGSRMAADDVDTEMPDVRQITYVQEKVDAANFGVSWDDDGPIVRNRSHILTKNYSGGKTPAKQQFVPAWGWAHKHEDSIREVLRRLNSPGTIYGEWMWARHSIAYDLLPDYFLAYDVWSAAAKAWVSPGRFYELFHDTELFCIHPTRLSYTVEGRDVTAREALQEHLDRPSDFRTGNREGIVIKTVDGADQWVTGRYKVVRSDFARMDESWNKRPMVRNELRKS